MITDSSENWQLLCGEHGSMGQTEIQVAISDHSEDLGNLIALHCL